VNIVIYEQATARCNALLLAVEKEQNSSTELDVTEETADLSSSKVKRSTGDLYAKHYNSMEEVPTTSSWTSVSSGVPAFQDIQAVGTDRLSASLRSSQTSTLGPTTPREALDKVADKTEKKSDNVRLGSVRWSYSPANQDRVDRQFSAGGSSKSTEKENLVIEERSNLDGGRVSISGAAVIDASYTVEPRISSNQDSAQDETVNKDETVCESPIHSGRTSCDLTDLTDTLQKKTFEDIQTDSEEQMIIQAVTDVHPDSQTLAIDLAFTNSQTDSQEQMDRSSSATQTTVGDKRINRASTDVLQSSTHGAAGQGNTLISKHTRNQIFMKSKQLSQSLPFGDETIEQTWAGYVDKTFKTDLMQRNNDHEFTSTTSASNPSTTQNDDTSVAAVLNTLREEKHLLM